jgi:hypothetical protein
MDQVMAGQYLPKAILRAKLSSKGRVKQFLKYFLLASQSSVLLVQRIGSYLI